MIRKLRSAAAVVSLLACCSATLGQVESFRGVWVDAFGVGFKSTAQINDLVSRAVAGNYNVIIAEVLAYHDRTGGGHGAYWNSAIVPKALDISGGIDPLAVLLSTAHAAGLEVHAWIVPYRVSSSWPPSGNTYLAAHPEYLMVPSGSIGGGPATVGGVYVLDPGSPHVQEYLTNIVQELVGNYAIDGINLDYIRYTQVDAGYPADNGYPHSSLQRFRDLTGYVGTPAPTGVTSWNDFRRQTITEFVRRLRAEIPSIPNPRQPLRLTADLICFGNAPAGGNFTLTDAYALHSNWKLWLDLGYLDAGIPMNYKRDNIPTQATWYRNWVDQCIVYRGDRHIFQGHGAYLNTKANSLNQINYALAAGSDGIATYSYRSTADEDLNGTPEADWTWYPLVGGSSFSTPAVLPPMPWRDPALAVEGTVWGQVFNDQTGQPVDGATVTLSGLPAVTTDGNGYFVITLAPAAPGGTSYTLTVTANGCPVVIEPGVMALPGDVTRYDVLVCPLSLGKGDFNDDGFINWTDTQFMLFCMQGPDNTYSIGNVCLKGDFDPEDLDVDLADFAEFQIRFTGP